MVGCFSFINLQLIPLINLLSRCWCRMHSTSLQTIPRQTSVTSPALSFWALNSHWTMNGDSMPMCRAPNISSQLLISHAPENIPSLDENWAWDGRQERSDTDTPYHLCPTLVLRFSFLFTVKGIELSQAWATWCRSSTPIVTKSRKTPHLLANSKFSRLAVQYLVLCFDWIVISSKRFNSRELCVTLASHRDSQSSNKDSR